MKEDSSKHGAERRNIVKRPKLKRDIIVNGLLKSTMAVMISAMIAAVLGMMVDGILIGRFLGADRTAAYGLTAPIMVTGALLGGLLSSGTVMQMSQCRAKGDEHGFSGFFSMVILETLGVSLVLVLLQLVFLEPLMTLLGGTGKAAYLRPYMKDYILGLLPAIPLLILMEFLNQAVQLDGDKKLPMLGILVLMIADILLDLVNVYLLKWDILGMALASTVSYYLAAGISLMHFFRPSCTIRFRLHDLPWNKALSLLGRGLPGATSRLMSVVRSLGLNRILLAVASASAVAAFSVNNSVGYILTAAANGIANCCVMLTGIFLVDKDRKSLCALLKNALRYAVLFSLAISAVFFLLADQIAGLFMAHDPEVMAEAATVIRYYSVYVPLFAIGVVYQNYLQGTQNIVYSVVVSVFCHGGLLLLIAMGLGRFNGAQGVWMAFPVSAFCVLIVIFCAACLFRRQFPETWEDLCFLPKSTEIRPGNYLESTITDRSQITEFSEQVRRFCGVRDPDPKKANLCALCAEEIIFNTLDHGSKNVTEPCVDSRVTWADGTFTLRFRDNCNPFDPYKYFQQEKEDPDKTKHIGIRAVFGNAAEIRYANIMRLNSLIVVYGEKADQDKT